MPAAVVANGDAYFDARGPLRADWRAGDSAWSPVDGDALGRALVQVRSLDGHGELERFMTEHDARRPYWAGDGRRCSPFDQLIQAGVCSTAPKLTDRPRRQRRDVVTR